MQKNACIACLMQDHVAGEIPGQIVVVLLSQRPGLALSLNAAAKHWGSLRFDSNETGGTRVSVWLRHVPVEKNAVSRL